MTIPRKDSRRVRVGNLQFRYIVARQRAEDPNAWDFGDSAAATMRRITAQEEVANPGRVLQWYVAGGSAIQPADVRKVLAYAVKHYWNPTERGAARVLTPEELAVIPETDAAGRAGKRALRNKSEAAESSQD